MMESNKLYLIHRRLFFGPNLLKFNGSPFYSVLDITPDESLYD